jgi:hypothetical protein
VSTRRQIEERAEFVAGESLFHYFYGRSAKDFHHPLLKVLYGQDTLRTKTTLQGLLTSLGVTLWEKLATVIAAENGFEVQDPKEVKQPDNLPQPHAELMDLWEKKRRADSHPVSLEDLSKELRKKKYSIPENLAMRKLTKSDGLDVFLTKENVDYYFDIKTVDWNTGSSYKFNSSLLRWKIFHRLQRPKYDLRPYFVIPYGIAENWWTEIGPKVSPLQKDDVLVGNQFWDLLTGRRDSLRYISIGFDNFAKKAGVKELYAQLLTQNSERLNLELIRLHRRVKYAGNAESKAGTRSKFLENWCCCDCDSTFPGTRKYVVDNFSPCPFCRQNSGHVWV